jgi:type III secretion protein C
LPATPVHFSQAVQEQPIGDFLRGLFSKSAIRIDISPNLTGSISGSFDGEPAQVFRKIASAFNLSSYYDGDVLYIYPKSENSVVYLGSNRSESVRLQAAVKSARLADEQNRVQLSGEKLLVSGSKHFIARVESISVQRPASKVRTPAVREAVAAKDTAPNDDPDKLEYRVYYLRYGWAADSTVSSGNRTLTISGVVTILKGLIGDDRQERAAPTEEATALKPAAQPGLAGRGLAAQDGHSAPTTLASLFGLAGNVDVKPAAPLPVPTARPAEQNEHGERDRIRIQADRRLNAIIIRGARAQLDAYGELIRALDVEPQIVEIEATIIDVDIERLKKSGVAFGFVGPNGSQIVSSPDPGALTATPDQGLYISTVVGSRDKFIARLNALETTGVARIVSRPLVLTLSDVEAVFQNNQTFYVPVKGSLSTDLYNVTAGTTLRVTPHVTQDRSENRIRLLLDIQDGALTNQNVGAIPVVQQSSVSTEAVIVDGQSLLVGGMISQSKVDGGSKIPVLADLPVVGGLFRSGSTSSDHIERLFLITPRLSAVGSRVHEPVGMTEPLRQGLSQEAPQ